MSTDQRLTEQPFWEEPGMTTTQQLRAALTQAAEQELHEDQLRKLDQVNRWAA